MQPLNAAQLAELKSQLEALKGELEGLLASTEDGARPVDLDEPIGRLSRMDAMQQQKMVEANRRSHAARLRLVRAALDTVDTDAYGLCHDCDEPIGLARLKARPEVAICVRCQTERERG